MSSFISSGTWDLIIPNLRSTPSLSLPVLLPGPVEIERDPDHTGEDRGGSDLTSRGLGGSDIDQWEPGKVLHPIRTGGTRGESKFGPVRTRENPESDPDWWCREESDSHQWGPGRVPPGPVGVKGVFDRCRNLTQGDGPPWRWRGLHQRWTGWTQVERSRAHGGTGHGTSYPPGRGRETQTVTRDLNIKN